MDVEQHLSLIRVTQPTSRLGKYEPSDIRFDRTTTIQGISLRPIYTNGKDYLECLPFQLIHFPLWKGIYSHLSLATRRKIHPKDANLCTTVTTNTSSYPSGYGSPVRMHSLSNSTSGCLTFLGRLTQPSSPQSHPIHVLAF